MLKPIIIMFKCCTCIIWWININTFHFARKFLLQSFKRKQVVTKNQSVVKCRRFRPHFGVIGFFRVFEQNPRL